MGKQSGLGAGLYVAGFEISNDIRDLGRIGGGPAVLDKTGIDKSAFERIGGVKSGELSLTAHFNPDANRAHAVLRSLPTDSRIVTYRQGSAIGGDAASIRAKQINYDPTRAADGDLTQAVQYLNDGSHLDWGNLLTAGVRTDSGATNGASWDSAAATAFGIQAYVHLTAFIGTSVTISIEDSADNSVWAALAGGSFGALSAVTGATLTTGRTAVTRRYLRVATTGTFTNASFLVAVVKNQTTVLL